MSKRRRVGCTGVVAAVVAVAVCSLPCLAASSWKIGAQVAYVDGETGIWDMRDMEMLNETDGITVVSKRAKYDRDTRTVDFIDSVRVTQSGTVVNAESGSFSTETNTGSFRGSVSLVRPRTEEEAFDMELTCEELDLDTATDSFVARRNAVLRYVDEDGEETILWADQMDYDAERRLLKLTNVSKASSPSLPEGSQLAARTMELNTETGDMNFTGLDLVLVESDDAETES